MFEEDIFIRSLIERPEDARRFSQIFKPQWLNRSELAPILQTIYEFTRENGEPPSIITIRKILQGKDSNAYNLRYKETIDKLEKTSPDRSEMIYTVGIANNVATIRSFRELCQDDQFLLAQEDNEGSEVVRNIQDWLVRLAGSEDNRTMNLRQAVDNLIQSSEFDSPNTKIPCGIKPIDDWTGGGLRKKQLAIYMAPTGMGKSIVLLIIGHKIATIERKNTWLITNELVMEEVTERALARMKGIDVGRIMDNPTVAYKGLDRQWQQGLDKRFYITEYTKETTTDDLEAELEKLKNLHGWKPDVIVLDYMERMKPTAAGYKRDKEWGWMGAIAKDLIRLAKKKNLLIWTAAQMNREGLSSDDLNLSMAQASIRHLQEATAVIAGRQIDIPNSEDKVIRMKPVKMRQSKRSGKSVNLRCNLAKMSISNEEVEELEEDDGSKNASAMTPAQKQKKKRK